MVRRTPFPYTGRPTIPFMAIDPTRDDVRTFMQEDDGEPIVMLNLLRFAPDGGEDGYARYAAHFHDEALAEAVLQPTVEWRVA